MNPLVSVITVFHNRAAEVGESIGSLLAQTYAPLEIIAVDDGSTDGTADALRAIDDPRLKVIVQANRGFTPSIDAAVRQAAGEYVAVHGSGDISMPTRMARQAAVLDAHSELAVVGCRVCNDDGDVKPDRQPRSTEQPLTYLEVVRINPITHGEVMFRKAAFLQVGGYRSFFQFAQDHDLWLRMDRAGKFWSIREPLYVRKRFANSVNADPVKLMLQACYGEFAEQCSRSVDERGRDLLDRYGTAAGFLFDPQPKHVKKLTGLGMNALVRGDERAGHIVLAASLLQRRNRRTKVAAAVSAVSEKRPELWRAVRPLAAWLMTRRAARKAAAQ